MGTNYDKILKILQKWPMDSTKKGRDYGCRLRDFLRNKEVAANKNIIFPGNAVENSLMINSLTRLADNKYKKMFTYNFKYAATGVPLNHLEIIMSDEFNKQVSKKKIII